MMPELVDYEDAYARRMQRKGRVRIPFMDADALHPDRPYSLMNRIEQTYEIEPHFHSTDQWQFVAEGDAILGRQRISRYCLHFNRAYTPYGPLKANNNREMAYFDLYSRYQPGAFPIVGAEGPQNMAFLKRISNRNPWQIKRQVTFPSQRGIRVASEVQLESIPEIRDDNGLYACSLVLPPDARCRAPDPSIGAGQYIVAVNGSLRHEGKEHKTYVVILDRPTEGPLEICAGAAGLEALILNFPRDRCNKIIWKCQSCDFVFDEAQHVPSDGNAIGGRWRDLPTNWPCPGCAALKTTFLAVEVK
jgi:rubredoxin